MDGEVIAEGLAFPEGSVWDGGELVFTEITGGRLTRWSASRGVETVATTGGGPNGAAKGPDGTFYVTQNGGMAPGEARITAGIQRVEQDGTVTLVTSEVDGRTLDGPNDLAFGPDGRLYFTDPRGDANPARNELPGRIYAIDAASGEGELVVELGPVFPNGIAFLADGTLAWTESFTRRVVALVDGKPEVLVEQPERHAPDGMCVGADGRLYVASTFSHAVTVVEGGQIVDKLVCGDGMPTNCCFGGTDLYVTESRRGTIWRFPLGVTGLPLPHG